MFDRRVLHLRYDKINNIINGKREDRNSRILRIDRIDSKVNSTARDDDDDDNNDNNNNSFTSGIEESREEGSAGFDWKKSV